MCHCGVIGDSGQGCATAKGSCKFVALGKVLADIIVVVEVLLVEVVAESEAVVEVLLVLVWYYLK